MSKYIKITVLILFFFSKPVFSSDSLDKSMNNLLAAVATITKERAEKLNWMNISNIIREDLCGYNKWDSTIFVNRKLFVYFPEACNSVRFKWSQDIKYDKTFLRAFQQDILNNSIHIVYGDFYKQTIKSSDEKLYEEYKKYKKEFKKNSSTKDIIAEMAYKGIKDYSHNNLDVSSKEFYNEALTKTKQILIDYYQSDNEQLNIVQDEFYLSKLKGFYNVLGVDVDLLDSALSEVKNKKLITVLTLSAFYEMTKGELLVEDYKNNFEKVLNEVLNDSYADISKVIHLKKDFHQKFIIYYEYLLDNRENLKNTVLDITEDYKYKIENNYKAIRILMMFASVLENNDTEDSTRLILESFASDINSREMRYWERVWSVGSLAGLSVGNETDSSSEASAYIPFGILTTKGMHNSWMVHFFDLGQYLNYSDQDESVDWRDAVMPGVSYIFARNRRYGFAAGVDVSYFRSASDSQSDGDYRFSVFVAMEVPIWELN